MSLMRTYARRLEGPKTATTTIDWDMRPKRQENAMVDKLENARHAILERGGTPDPEGLTEELLRTEERDKRSAGQWLHRDDKPKHVHPFWPAGTR